MRQVVIAFCALALDASLLGQARAAQVCAWIDETLDEGGGHKFELNLSSDAPTSVAVRFAGPGFASGAMGGDMIQLDPGEAKDVDGEGFDVSAGDDVRLDVQLFDHPVSLDDLDTPTSKPLAAFVFDRKAGDERTPPPDLAVNQCKHLG